MHTKREPDLYPTPCILSAAGKIVLPWRHYFCLKGIDWHLLSRGHKKTPRKGRPGNGKSHGGREKRLFRRAFSAILAFFVADTDTDVNSFSTGFENLFWQKSGKIKNDGRQRCPYRPSLPFFRFRAEGRPP